MNKKNGHSDLGFTLVELIIVIALIGVLAALALPKFANVQSSSQVNFVNGVIDALIMGRDRWNNAWTVAYTANTIDALSTYYMSLPLTTSSTQNEYYLMLNSSGYPIGAPMNADTLAAAGSVTGFGAVESDSTGNRYLSAGGGNDVIAVICARIFFNLMNNPNISVGHSAAAPYTTDFLWDNTCNVTNIPSTKSAFCVVPGAAYSNSTQCYYQYQGNTAIHILYTPATGAIAYNG